MANKKYGDGGIQTVDHSSSEFHKKSLQQQGQKPFQHNVEQLQQNQNLPQEQQQNFSQSEDQYLHSPPEYSSHLSSPQSYNVNSQSLESDANGEISSQTDHRTQDSMNRSQNAYQFKARQKRKMMEEDTPTSMEEVSSGFFNPKRTKNREWDLHTYPYNDTQKDRTSYSSPLAANNTNFSPSVTLSDTPNLITGGEHGFSQISNSQESVILSETSDKQREELKLDVGEDYSTDKKEKVDLGMLSFGIVPHQNSSLQISEAQPSSLSLVSPSFSFGNSSFSTNRPDDKARDVSTVIQASSQQTSTASQKQVLNIQLDTQNNTEYPTNFSGEFRERGMSIPGSINGHSFDHFVRMLDVMGKEQLISLIVNLMKENTKVQYEVATAIPRPTVEVVRRLLGRSEQELLESVPYKKMGADRSAYAFNRVRGKIAELKDRIFYYLDFFVQPSSYPQDMRHEYPEAAMSYLALATEIVHRLPRWDSDQHNQYCTGEIYERLGVAWQVAIMELARMIKEEGKMFDKSTVANWTNSLNIHYHHVQGQFGFKTAMDLLYNSLSWIIKSC